MRALRWILVGALGAGGLFLLLNGVLWLARGLGFLADERLADGGQPMVVVLGALQIVGAVVVLACLRHPARALGLLSRRAPDPGVHDSIRERALANRKASAGHRS